VLLDSILRDFTNKRHPYNMKYIASMSTYLPKLQTVSEREESLPLALKNRHKIYPVVLPSWWIYPQIKSELPPLTQSLCMFAHLYCIYTGIVTAHTSNHIRAGRQLRTYISKFLSWRQGILPSGKKRKENINVMITFMR